MRVLATLLLLVATSASARDTRFGLAGGLVVPLDLRVDDRQPDAEPGPLLVVSFDQRVLEDLDVGFFLHVGSITAEVRDEQVNLFALGVAAHHVLPSEIGLLRFGGGVGYRRLFADASTYDRVHGLAINADAELSKEIAPRLVGQVEVGLLSQPWGSNGASRVSWLPIPYVTIGVVL